MKKYIYHIKPQKLFGNHLIPLNNMEPGSEVYRSNIKKYEGREKLMDQRIPMLNCRWNDVVQFSSMNPGKIIDKLKTINTKLTKKEISFYKFDVEEIANKYESIVFDRKSKDKKFEINLEDCTKLSYSSYTELTTVPTATVEYWHDVKKRDGIFLMFPFVPHVFVKAKVDLNLAETVVYKL